MAARDLIGLVYNSLVPDAQRLVESLADSLKIRDRCWIRSVAEITTAEELLPQTSVVITYGGDGTILKSVRVVAPHEVPILGINLGRVGFMTELGPREAESRVPEYLHGNPRVEERMMLQATLGSDSAGREGRTVHALNEAVVGRANVAKLVDIAVIVDGVPVTTYRADGVVVATATGSTGYALSAGGPILHPEGRAMLIQPVASHMTLQSGLLLPEDSVVRLNTPGDAGAHLAVDGFLETAIGSDDTVTVKRSPFIARFLRAGPPSAFYSTLVERLRLKNGPGTA